MAKKKGTVKPKGGTSAVAIRAREREAKAIEMRLAGSTLDAIAKAIGYASPECARVAILRAMEKIPGPENVAELRNREVERMNEVEREAWQQWRRSTQDAQKRVEADTKDGPMVTETTEGQSGNPSLLDKIIKASERRAKLLGLDAPERLDVRGEGEIRVIGQSPVEIFDNAAKRARGE